MKTRSSNNNKRPIGLIESSQDHVMSIVIKSQSIESPRYEDVLTDYDIIIGRIHFNWNPVSFNRVVRFLRYMYYVEDVAAGELVKIR